MNLLETKKELYQYCVQYIDRRINNSLTAIQNAQESANSEVKSSAGDKHETGRAMAQLETENNSKQLAESNKLRHVINQINSDKKSDKIEMGALAVTSVGTFYIAISIGKVNLNNNNYFVISAVSPIGQALLNAKKGDKVKFNGKEIKVLNIA